MSRVGERVWKWVQRSVERHMQGLPKRAYMGSLLRNLREYPQLSGRELLVKERIEELYNEGLKRHELLVIDSRALIHLQLACFVEGAYMTLLPWFGNDQEKVIDIIRKPLGESAAGFVGLSQKIALLFSFDGFPLVSRSLKYMESDFGKAFIVNHHIMPNFHRASVKRCLYHSVFVADGIPELTSIFCALDRMWFDQVHPEKHGVKFSRPCTLARGDTSCEFIVERSKDQITDTYVQP